MGLARSRSTSLVAPRPTLAASGVAIMSNAPGDRPFPPVAELNKSGVVVFSGNDNIRNSWWPYGDGDMLGRAMLVGYRSGFFTDDELAMALDLATGNGAKVLRLPSYGLAVGAMLISLRSPRSTSRKRSRRLRRPGRFTRRGALLRRMGCWLRASWPAWSRACPRLDEAGRPSPSSTA